MGWVLLSLRRNELQSSIQDHQYELLQLSSRIRKLGNFSSAIGDGQITPSEIASFGNDLFGDALDFMGYSNEAAMEAAELQTSYYEQVYGDVTADQYATSGLSAQASLYFDPETGALNTDAMYQEFYEKALQEYAEQYVMPKLKELETELENQKSELEAQMQSEEAELESVKDSISQSIQNSAIQLS